MPEEMSTAELLCTETLDNPELKALMEEALTKALPPLIHFTDNPPHVIGYADAQMRNILGLLDLNIKARVVEQMGVSMRAVSEKFEPLFPSVSKGAGMASLDVCMHDLHASSLLARKDHLFMTDFCASFTARVELIEGTLKDAAESNPAFTTRYPKFISQNLVANKKGIATLEKQVSKLQTANGILTANFNRINSEFKMMDAKLEGALREINEKQKKANDENAKSLAMLIIARIDAFKADFSASFQEMVDALHTERLAHATRLDRHTTLLKIIINEMQKMQMGETDLIFTSELGNNINVAHAVPRLSPRLLPAPYPVGPYPLVDLTPPPIVHQNANAPHIELDHLVEAATQAAMIE